MFIEKNATHLIEFRRNDMFILCLIYTYRPYGTKEGFQNV